MRERQLHACLAACFSDWQGDFRIDIEHEEYSSPYGYFSVLINHKEYGEVLSATARVSDDGQCQIEFGEGAWVEIAKADVFALMWFEHMQRALAREEEA